LIVIDIPVSQWVCSWCLRSFRADCNNQRARYAQNRKHLKSRSKNRCEYPGQILVRILLEEFDWWGMSVIKQSLSLRLPHELWGCDVDPIRMNLTVSWSLLDICVLIMQASDFVQLYSWIQSVALFIGHSWYQFEDHSIELALESIRLWLEALMGIFLGHESFTGRKLFVAIGVLD
jgi:hypothetical protein